MSPAHRRVNPVILGQLERAKIRIEHVITNYNKAGYPDYMIDFNLRQAIHSLRQIQKEIRDVVHN